VQIAGALAQAHQLGVLHRDLKPGNIILTRSGAKLLDFGLAKLRHAESAGGATVTDLTEEGTILGTLHYMSPEQLEGKPTGAGSDIFSFGAVLYEMATGRKAFAGESRASVMASILTSEPPTISTLPAGLDRIVRACLAKKPEERWHSAHDLARELGWTRESRTKPAAAIEQKTSRLPWMIATMAILAASLCLVLYFWPGPKPQRDLLQFHVSPPDQLDFAPFVNGARKISPDGRHLAFIGQGKGQGLNLWVHDFDSSSARVLADTKGASNPFWSPDSRYIAFFADRKLKRISTAGGSPQSICDAPAPPRGGTWSRNDVILFVPNAGAEAGLFQVPAGGGIPKRVTSLDVSRSELWHWWPNFLPDGKHFLYLASGQKKEIRTGSLDSSEHASLAPSAFGAVYASSPGSATGHLLFVNSKRTLMAQPFDPRKLRLFGDPTPIADNVSTGSETQEGSFTVSDNEILTYQPLQVENFSQLVWFDRSGKSIRTVGTPSSAPPHNSQLRLSPDEKKLAISRIDPQARTHDIWLLDLTRDTESRLTFDPGWDICSVFSPDGAFLVFLGGRNGTNGFYRRALKGLGREELIHKNRGPDYPNRNRGPAYPSDWSKDGRFILFVQLGVEQLKGTLWVLPLFGDRKPMPYLETAADTKQGQFSPNGKWVAYTSDESGHPEVYVQPFPATGVKWQISTNRGAHPLWRRDGAELFYIGGDGNLMAAPVRVGPTFEHGSPVVLFQTHREPDLVRYEDMQYAVSADGKRFLIPTPVASSPPVTVMVNWTAGLKGAKSTGDP
jgi:eukaryotic-like serine/threonine-protein kinase